MSLVLISRTMSKLGDCRREIVEKYPNIDVKVIQADFERLDIYDHIENELKDIDIGMLVNNVGAALDPMHPLDQQDRETIIKMINLNMTSVAMTTQIVIGRLKEKRRGVVINISSATAILPPLFIIYSTAKAWVRRFSYGLRLQYRKYGVIVQDVEPLFVRTKLAPSANDPSMIEPETCARESLLTVGHYDETAGAVRHELFTFVFSLIPEFLMVKTLEGNVEKAMKELEAKKAN